MDGVYHNNYLIVSSKLKKNHVSSKDYMKNTVPQKPSNITVIASTTNIIMLLQQQQKKKKVAVVTMKKKMMKTTTQIPLKIVMRLMTELMRILILEMIIPTETNPLPHLPHLQPRTTSIISCCRMKERSIVREIHKKWKRRRNVGSEKQRKMKGRRESKKRTTKTTNKMQIMTTSQKNNRTTIMMNQLAPKKQSTQPVIQLTVSMTRKLIVHSIKVVISNLVVQHY
mmetsp:Transcript_10092/g.24301  ORF Transcript_10092/g.24301 Transcript_10092/m.24301 type:complete len:226 (+) Transcript_10092:240-917(+)